MVAREGNADAAGEAAAKQPPSGAKRSQTPPPTNRKAESQSKGDDASGDGVRQRRSEAEHEAGTSADKAEAAKTPRGLVQRAWAAYLGCLSQKPICTKAITAAAISAVGNIICQVWIEGAAVDPVRMLYFALLNALYITPVLHVWHAILNRLLPKPGIAGALSRMLPDQLLFSPIFNYGLMILLFSSLGEAVLPSVDQWKDFIVSSWKVWPPATLVIFWLVPPDLHMVALNLVNLAWSVRVSALKVAASS